VKAFELKDIKIVRIQQELHATNSATFKKSIYKLTGLKPHEYLIVKNKLNALKEIKQNIDITKNNNDDDNELTKLPSFKKVKIVLFILISFLK
jgi:hypothetical protein